MSAYDFKKRTLSSELENVVKTTPEFYIVDNLHAIEDLLETVIKEENERFKLEVNRQPETIGNV